MDGISLFGQEVSIEDPVAWEALTPYAGQVLEVHMNSTSLTVLHDSWAGFFIDKVEIHLEGSATLHTRAIDAEDQTVSDALVEFSDSGRFAIHLCRSRPCAEVGHEQEGKLHVTRVRIFDFADYIDSADYVSAGQKKLARGWNRYLVKKREEAAIRRREGAGDKEDAAAGDVGRSAKKKATPPGKVKARADTGEASAGTPVVSEELRSKLKERLRTVKERINPPKAKVGGDEEEDPNEEASNDSSEPEVTDYARDHPKLSGGTSLVPRPPALVTGALGGDRVPGEETTIMKRKKKKKKAIEDRDTKGISSGSLRGQLVQRAVLAAQSRKSSQKHKYKKKKKEDATKKLTDALASILTKSSGKKKKKRRKRKVTADGVIESCSSSSSSNSDSDDQEVPSSDQDYETPMRKRSRDHPGSVLQLLTDHVRDQLQQAATTEMDDVDNSVTSGVKVMTYFMLQLRPHFQGYQREMRELHHLAACIDALRRGDVATTGDALAGRFIALHQSMLDQNWHTARHMEIFPMEDSTAANTAMVLATRKHSKLVAKAQGLSYPTPWVPRGKGRGRGDWHSWNDAKGESKGEKGKGKKGKSKGKGKHSWGDVAPGGDWKERKERPEEKQA